LVSGWSLVGELMMLCCHSYATRDSNKLSNVITMDWKQFV